MLCGPRTEDFDEMAVTIEWVEDRRAPHRSSTAPRGALALFAVIPRLRSTNDRVAPTMRKTSSAPHIADGRASPCITPGAATICTGSNDRCGGFRRLMNKPRLWAAIALLAVHAVAIIALPLRLSWCGTVCIVLAELAACFACFRVAVRSSFEARIPWSLLGSSI